MVKCHSFSQETHLRTIEHHLPYGIEITQITPASWP